MSGFKHRFPDSGRMQGFLFRKQNNRRADILIGFCED